MFVPPKTSLQPEDLESSLLSFYKAGFYDPVSSILTTMPKSLYQVDSATNSSFDYKMFYESEFNYYYDLLNQTPRKNFASSLRYEFKKK